MNFDVPDQLNYTTKRPRQSAPKGSPVKKARLNETQTPEPSPANSNFMSKPRPKENIVIKPFDPIQRLPAMPTVAAAKTPTPRLPVSDKVTATGDEWADFMESDNAGDDLFKEKESNDGDSVSDERWEAI